MGVVVMPRAPMICLEAGCLARAVRRGRCDEHAPEPWQGSSWRQGKPRGWDRIRREVLRRDRFVCGLCRGGGADSVDHIVARAHGGSEHPSNLHAVHRLCHQRKTQREARER
ncbi:HNH endonuclease [Streptomyces sp. NPDC001407]|uniref:HNH endonuclease n=1 Tax=Streptomyces sp. NPDC001407 TaxID=3364573 RepID=UPI0036B69609